MGAGKSKAEHGAKSRSQGKVEDLEAGGGAGGGGTSFVIPDAATPAAPASPYMPIR
jgi:hypothetical protein